MSTLDDRLAGRAMPHESTTSESKPSLGAARRTSPTRSLAVELVQTVVLTVLIFLAVRSVVQNFRVEGDSMLPTFTTGEYLLINKAAYFHVDGTPLDHLLPTTHEGSVDYLFGGPKRGDIVVFQAPTQPGKDFIKRVIGLPGDSVLIRDGVVYVNGQRLNEPYIRFHASYTYPANGVPLTVPGNQYFVLGDNRPNSSDSHLGWTVPVQNLIGRAWIDYWPPSDWAAIPAGHGV